MCWYISTSPRPAGSKKLKPSERSKRTMNCETAMNGVAMTTSSEVEKFAQTSSGDAGSARELHPDGEEDLPFRRCHRERRVGRPAAGERAARRREGQQHHD